MLSRHLLASRSMLIAVVFCFFLPFITVSCTSVPVKSTISGLNLVTGADARFDTPQGSQLTGDRVPARSEMIAAFIGALAALVATFLKISMRAKSVAVVVGSGLGALFFFVLKSALDNEARNQSQLLLTYEAGFWLAWMLLLAAFALNSWVLYQSFAQKVVSLQPDVRSLGTTVVTPMAHQPRAVVPNTTVYCPDCGNQIESTSKFCMYCGKNNTIHS